MRIGISKSVIEHNGFVYDAIDQGWYQTLRGHQLFLVPNTMSQDFNIMANDLDSFILSGGESSETRKSVELELANKMLQRNKPVVGIAEGAFTIAELLGGTFEPINNHNGLSHPIFYHREVLEVSSYHDTCIKTLPENTSVLCLDYLGNIEAFVNGNSAGLVWNPEKMEEPWIPPEIAYMLRI